jgi:putative glutamine amidotransferase
VKIGLAYTGSEEKHNNYVQWLKAGDEIEIIKLSTAAQPFDQSFDYDALVLSGGIDTHPRFYHGNINYPEKPEKGWDELRDEYELSLLKDAFERSLPVLGICRGMQLINICQGGTMIQHIMETTVAHVGGPDKKHLIKIRENSLLYEITGRIYADYVNSAHHQAVDKIGDGLIENCWSEDNIIEGLEWKDKTNKSFLLGVQWHPERMKNFALQNSPLSKNIRDYFIKEINKNSDK